MSDAGPVVIFTTEDPMEGAMLKSELDAAGFACELLNVQHTTMMLGGGFAIGIRLIVPSEQAAEAKAFIDEILKRWAQAAPKAAAPEPEGIVRCGNCGEPLDADSVFCDQCGARLPSSE